MDRKLKKGWLYLEGIGVIEERVWSMMNCLMSKKWSGTVMINMVRELREREGADLQYQRMSMSLMAETSSRTV